MASKYLQKFPVPDGFREILHDFTREILRVQPQDIIDFSEQYFEYQKNNPNGPDKDWDSKYNIQRTQQPNSKKYQQTPHSQISNQAKRVVDISNDRPAESKPPRSGYGAPIANAGQGQVGEPAVKRPPSGLKEERQTSTPQPPQQARSQRADSGQSDKVNMSHGSHASSGSHPEEQKVTKQFIGGLYDNAINQVMTPTQGDHNRPDSEEHDQLGRNTQNVVLDGPVEEYDIAARQIQNNFKKKQTMAEDREIKTKARDLKIQEKTEQKKLAELEQNDGNQQEIEELKEKVERIQSERVQVEAEILQQEANYEPNIEPVVEEGNQQQQQVEQKEIQGNYQEELGQGGEEGEEEDYGEGDGQQYEDGGEEYEEGSQIGLTNEQIAAVAAEVFAQADTDGSGYIEQAQFYTLLQSISQLLGLPPVGEEAVNQMLEQLDQNKDGKLSLEEFTGLVEQVLLAVINAMNQQINAINDGEEEQDEGGE